MISVCIDILFSRSLRPPSSRECCLPLHAGLITPLQRVHLKPIVLYLARCYSFFRMDYSQGSNRKVALSRKFDCGLECTPLAHGSLSSSLIVRMLPWGFSDSFTFIDPVCNVPTGQGYQGFPSLRNLQTKVRLSTTEDVRNISGN